MNEREKCNMDKLLTISVAAYNVAPYLNKLIHSIINADSEKIEVLIVNDGSTDNTLELAKAAERKYPSIFKVIDKENGGHGSTINAGIKAASGKYFRALDGDDWVDSQGMKKLLNELDKSDADMILTNYKRCYENGIEKTEKVEDIKESKIYTLEETIAKVDRLFYHIVIYKSSILKEHNITLDEHSFYVDTEFMLFPLPYIHSVQYINCTVYCYRLGLNGQSVSVESRMKHEGDSYRVAVSLLNFFVLAKASLNLAISEYVQRYIAGHCVWHYRALLFFAPSIEYEKKLQSFDQMVQNCSPRIYEYMEAPGRGISEKDARIVSIMRNSKYILYPAYGIFRKMRNKK